MRARIHYYPCLIQTYWRISTQIGYSVETVHQVSITHPSICVFLSVEGEESNPIKRLVFVSQWVSAARYKIPDSLTHEVLDSYIRSKSLNAVLASKYDIKPPHQSFDYAKVFCFQLYSC